MLGKVLAQYQICEKLGEGGMGVVWKARDNHLERFVALKTLAADRLTDPERKRRAVQEAKAASSLNHPNIVHIYDIAEADGVQFISMEYVPGKTLDQLVGRNGLRLNEALKYAVQIADALAQAHSAGIVHRDLKPSNIIVSENGNVKVLDFGVAKLTEITTSEFRETASMRTQEGPSTEEGAIVGTVGYMSPEQAEGKRVDARSDIFSFGSMLYEMVTGRQAFQGESKISTLSAILKNDPKPMSEVAVDVPRDLEKIINHCLRKDPDRRFQHMADVKVALQELKEESDSGKLTNIGQSEFHQRNSHSMWRFAGVAILLAMAVALGFWFLRPRPHPLPRIVPLTTYQGRQMNPAFSPDGKQVAFVWNGEKENNFNIYVKLLDARTPLKLTNNSTTDDYSPAWSPDGRNIAFCRDRGERVELWMIPALGGIERRLGGLAGCSGLSWSPNGNVLVVTDKSTDRGPWALYTISPETGNRRRLTSPPNGQVGDDAPTFSPSGKMLAFARSTSGISAGIYLLSVTGSGEPESEPRRLPLPPDQQMIQGFDWTSDGRAIVFSSYQGGSTNLWMIEVSGGTPERLIGGENASDISISRTGNRLAISETHSIPTFGEFLAPLHSTKARHLRG